VIFFPQWIAQEPQRTVCFQNEHLDLMRSYRDAGPTYPKLVIDEFAEITFLEDAGRDDENVIACGADELPGGCAARRN
jgi:phenolic acid decarboxylase